MNANVSPEMLQILMKLPLFERLTEKEMDLMLERTVLNEYGIGEYLMREDDESYYMCVILSGKVDVTKRVQGKQKTLVTLGPGKCVGEMALVDRSPRSASAVASAPCKLLRLNRDALNQMPEIAAKVYHNIAAILAQRLRNANGAMTLADNGGTAPAAAKWMPK